MYVIELTTPTKVTLLDFDQRSFVVTGSKIMLNFKQAQMTKVTVSMCWRWTNIKKVYGDLFCLTYY